MVRNLFLILALITAAFPASSRTISGTVLSDKDSTAIVGASCRLMADSRFLAGTTTGSSGAFEINTDIRAAIELEIAMMGYDTTRIIIERGSGNISLGNVFLNEGVTLQELTVTAGRHTDSKGRTIVYPSSADVKASATSIGLFQKLPLAGLQANPINRTLSIDGGTPYILINGIPSTIDDVNALQPKDIDKIEYSRITPARYADKGNTGFLSITLKKRDDGGTVYAWGRSALNTAFVDANVKASYHDGPSQFSLNYNPSWRNYQSVYDNVTESYIGDDFRVDLEKHDRAPFNYFYQNIKLKYDYSPDAATLFSASFSATPATSHSRAIAETVDTELGEYDNRNTSRSKDFAPSLDLFFRKDFNEKNTIEAQVVGTLSSNDYRRDYLYEYSDGTEQNYIMNVDSRRRSLISEINYSHTFSEKTSLSAGFQNTVSHSKNTYLTSDYKPVLTENNNYIYARLGQQIGRVYFSIATGAKMFWVENDINKRHFIRNLSSASVSWNVNRHWNVQGVFSYTPSIPSLTSLTDYPQQTSPYLVSNGNPDLKVAENFYYRLYLTYQTGKFSASFSSSIMNSKNRVVDEVTYLGDRHFLSQSVNSRYSRNYQNTLSLNLSGVSGFGISLYLGLTHYQTAGETWKHHLTSFDASTTIWWNKGPFTVSYWRKFPGKYLYGHTVGKDENGDALQLEYKPDEHWTIGASWMYMFDTKGTKYPSWNHSAVNPSASERYIKDNGNMAVLSVSYSADFGSIFRSGRRSLNNSDNGSSLLKM